MNKIKELLDTEIASELATLEDMSLGDENTRISIDGLTKLLDRRIEFAKMEFDNQQKLEKQKLETESKEKELKLKEQELELKGKELDIKSEELETKRIDAELKKKQIRDERIDKIVKNVLTGVSIVSGCALTVWGTKKSFEFENTGTITTIMGRGFINKLLHKN